MTRESDAEDQQVDGVVLADLEGQEGDDSSEAAVDDLQEEDDSFHCFTGHEDSVFSVAWNPVDIYTVASGAQDDAAYLWKTCPPGEASPNVDLGCLKLEGHSDSVIDVAFNSDGTLLATASMDGVVKIWNMSGQHVGDLNGPSDSINWIRWHPRGDVLLAGSNDFSTWMWNVRSSTCMQVFYGHGGGVTCGGFSPDGRSVVTAGDDQDPSLRLWNPRSGEAEFAIRGHDFHEAGINCLDISEDGALSLTGSSDCTARVCSLSSGQPAATLREHTDSVESARFLNGVLPVMVTAGLDGKAVVWDKNTSARRNVYEHPAGVVCIDLVDQSAMFATGCMDGAVRVWDYRVEGAVKEIHGGRSPVQCVSVQRGSLVLAGYDDSTVKVFDLSGAAQ